MDKIIYNFNARDFQYCICLRQKKKSQMGIKISIGGDA